MTRQQLMALGSIVFAMGLIAGIAFTSVDMTALTASAHATQAGRDEPLISPTEAREREFYAPNSETLGPGEVRVRVEVTIKEDASRLPSTRV
jgi:hypothetical protein